jgi:aminoglycoside phosphotransferase (APT) family kinase protein
VPEPTDETLSWVIATAAAGSAVIKLVGLRDGASPWLISLSEPGACAVVLRLGTEADHPGLETEVAALKWAAAHGLPTPRLLGTDLGGEVSPGSLAVLTTALSGTSHLSGEPPRARLKALGEALALIHRVPPPSSPALPIRTSPIGVFDFAALRQSAPARPLLQQAEEEIAGLARPERIEVFVHGDFWHGNTLWDGDALSGVVDWDCAGVGQPGVDLGSLRCDAALSAGPRAADDALSGYERATGHSADDVAYWDIVAGLATPPTIDWFVDAFRGQGRVDLDQPTLLARRDAFLRSALQRLA